MPSNINLAAFIVGAVLLLVALTTGGVKIFGAQVRGTTGRGARIVAGLVGALLMVVGVWGPLPFNRQTHDPCDTLPVDERPLHCLEEKK
jgi:hypothetical protein